MSIDCTLEVVDGGLGNLVQDGGRPGYRAIGVPLGGAADRMLLACANHLVGNAPDAAAIEMALAGPRLRAVSGTLRVALAGRVKASLPRPGVAPLEVGAWRTATLFPGDEIKLGGIEGVAYLAVSGGLRLAPCLGSRSTYLRARLGGVDGRALAAGDRLPCGPVAGDPLLEWRAEAAFTHPVGPLRVLLGPQQDHFTAAAIGSFLGAAYRVTRDADRMGLRLDGPPLQHDAARGADIVSDGIVPGAIQVPGNGLPIVLRADAQTSGGYAKIATVIAADLPRLGQLLPGHEVRFAAVDLAAARRAWREQQQALAEWRARIVSFRPAGVVDEAALYQANLVSGVLLASHAEGDRSLLPWEDGI